MAPHFAATLELPEAEPGLAALLELLERELARIPLRRERRALALERRRVVLRLDELRHPRPRGLT